ncbi:MAG: DNA polymerase III subunit delta [bacterium]|nr:DNA polymerase III subunit delta [bacterium]
MLTILYSESDFLLEKAFQQARSRLMQGKENNFTCDVYEGKEASAGAILQGGQNISLFSKERLVVVKRAENLKKEELEQLEGFFKTHPQTETQYIFLVGKVDRRQKVWQSLISIADFKEIQPPAKRVLPDWIEEEAQSQGVHLSPEASFLLLDYLGEDLGVLSLSLKRLSLAFPGKKIGREEVEGFIADVSTRSVFDLTEAMGKKEVRQCFRLLQKGLSSRDNFPLLVSMIYRHFKILLNLQGASFAEASEVGRVLRVPPFFLKDYQAQVRYFSKEKCRLILKSLYTMDRQFKTSAFPSEILVQNFVRQVVA